MFLVIELLLRKSCGALRRFCKNGDSFITSERYLEDIPFKDQGREKQRLKGIKRKLEEESKLNTDEKLVERRPVSQPQKEAPREKKCRNPKKRDFDELQGDYALLKLLKKGKITEKEFDAAMGIDLEDNLGSGQKHVMELKPATKDDQSRDTGAAAVHKKNGSGVIKKGKGSQNRRKHGVNKKLRNKLI